MKFTPVEKNGQATQAQILLRCFSYLRPHWKLTTAAYVLMFLIDGINMLNPQIIAYIIDHGIGGKNLNVILIAVAILLGLVLLKGVFTYLQGKWTEVTSQNVAFDLRNELQRKITQLSFSFHDQSQTGDLLSRTIQDVERIRFLTGRATFRVVEGVVMILITAVVMILMNPKLGLLATACLPLLAFQAIRFGKRYRPISYQIQRQLSSLTTRVEQNLRGAQVIKSFGQEEAESARFDKENQSWFNLSALAARIQSTQMPLLQLVANVSSVIILWYGGTLVINQQLSLGELVAFTTYVAQLVSPVRFFGMVLPAITNAVASGERIFQILDTLPEVRESAHAVPIRISKGHVRFEKVDFSYGRHRNVLYDISLEAQPDQVIALLGQTGSGKTSIINLIPRFYDPTAGQILIDGQDIRTATLNSLRSQIGIVLQETTLFAATIRENIQFGRPDATLDEVINAARDAQAHEFILEMKDGYQTAVGERGVTLSGGQKQRLAIARSLLTNPRILILDDATSSVDTETEHLIQIALERVMENRTTFVIAHRLSTVQRADQIILLDKGRIAARGKHEELLQSSSLYKSIYQQQLKPASNSERAITG